MLTEEQYELLGDRMAYLYQSLEKDIISDVARRIKKTGRLTETAELQAKSMMEAGVPPYKIRTEAMKLLNADPKFRKEVANNTKQYKRDVIHFIRQYEKEAKAIGEEIIAEAGDMAFNKDLSLWHMHGKELTKNNSFMNIVKAMQEETTGSLMNITKSTGFRGVFGTIAVKNAYTNALDKALIKVTSGSFSFDQAANDCVMELAKSGLRSISYASGKTYNLDTAVRMAIRTSSSKLSARITMHNCEDTGTDLVEVDKHWGARPEHAAWQGKVYSISGNSKKYPDFKICGYGEATGLCGINCRHSFYPFFEGISIPNKWNEEPGPQEYNGKTYDYYQATQKQRQMERDIRSTKREIYATKVLGGDTKDLEARNRKQIAEYHSFSNAMGIRAKNNRLRVVEGTDITKTKSYKSINESRIAKEEGKKLFVIQPKNNGDVVSAEKIYKDLNKTDVGKSVIEFIKKNNTSVYIINDEHSVIDLNMESLYGFCIENTIYVNALTCKSKNNIVDTIVHETMHMKYDIGGDQHAEAVCDYYAELHRKGSLTYEDIRLIIESVKDRYPDLKWRERL